MMKGTTPGSDAPGGEKGFTLLEVLVSMSLLAFISVMVWSSFADSVYIRDTAEEEGALQHEAEVAMMTMLREVSVAFLTKNLSPTSTFVTLFRLEDGNPFDTLTFTSLSHRRLYRGSREGDETEITYFVEDDPEEEGIFTLMHREAKRIDGYPEEGGRIFPLARGVKVIDFRVYDQKKDEWLDEWDSEEPDFHQRLPKVMEIYMVMQDKGGEESSFVSSTYLSLFNKNL